jgi:hypothetical protein
MVGKNIWDLFSDGLGVYEKLGDTQKVSNKNNVFVAKVMINQWIRGYPMLTCGVLTGTASLGQNQWESNDEYDTPPSTISR